MELNAAAILFDGYWKKKQTYHDASKMLGICFESNRKFVLWKAESLQMISKQEYSGLHSIMHGSSRSSSSSTSHYEEHEYFQHGKGQ